MASLLVGDGSELPSPPIAVIADHMGHSLTEHLVQSSFWMLIWILMVFILFLFFPKCAYPGSKSESLFSPGTHFSCAIRTKKNCFGSPMSAVHMKNVQEEMSHFSQRALWLCEGAPGSQPIPRNPVLISLRWASGEKRNYLWLVIVIDNIYRVLTMCQAPY